MQNEVEEVLISVMSRSAPDYIAGWGAGACEGRQLEALLVYEDLSTGLRGRRTLEDVARQLNPEGHFKLNLWNFDLLAQTALLEEATREAASADIVLLSAHGQKELPAPVRVWYQHWLDDQRGGPKAVALSLDCRSRDTAVGGRILDGLRAAARRVGAKVFLHFGTPAPTDTSSARGRAEDRPTTGRIRSDLRPDCLEDHPSRDWGLND